MNFFSSMSDDFKKGMAVTAGIVVVLIVLSFLFGRR